jgi:hypothetical protein
MIRLAWRGKRPVENQHFSISTEALNFRPGDLARRPVTGQAFLGAPEASIIELNPSGGERIQPDGEHCCATTRAAWTTTPPFDSRIGPIVKHPDSARKRSCWNCGTNEKRKTCDCRCQPTDPSPPSTRMMLPVIQ